LVDAKGRAYFLWDEDLTLDVFRARLADPEVRAYYLGKQSRSPPLRAAACREQQVHDQRRCYRDQRADATATMIDHRA
jgi:hypothetical protein